MNDIISAYLDRYGCDRRWNMEGPAPRGIETVIIIPALAESTHLFETLESIAKNDGTGRSGAMVVCVINNGVDVSEIDRRDNERTLALLRKMNGKYRELPLAYIDASSPGRELPAKGGGVGFARKIGMDRALELFDRERETPKLLLCLDADTLVEPDWLSVVRGRFTSDSLTAAAVEFSHRRGGTSAEDDAIVRYETLIRYYVLGLDYAGSSYSYHSIGSTMAVTAEGYAAVRGMSRRPAGEDFHFLNKVAKIGRIDIIDETRVYPSARVSSRVLFGTGRAVAEGTAQGASLKYGWNPEVFRVLKEWTLCLETHASEDAGRLLERVRDIHPETAAFLEEERFAAVWPRLQENSARKGTTERHARTWFDALKTYRLIRRLTRTVYQPIDLYEALYSLIIMIGLSPPSDWREAGRKGLEERRDILEFLRNAALKPDRISRESLRHSGINH
ncbi:MAG: hypothetical protein AVO39_08725 [delta proteobacterium MLS_D]|jgi:hypothetical protein|nr:MAG: hypothetical protein AVO39_08725 [delta proteobacterium MLS_D]